jgi:hypothetical protein
LLLNILKDCVIDPTVVKTVSKDKVSASVDNVAAELVIKESFLHEKNISVDRKRRNGSFNLFNY